MIYDWKRDEHDARDITVTLFSDVKQTHVDLRSKMPPVFDQSSLGSCTANALAGAYEFEEKVEDLREICPSRLFIYYNERNMEKTVNRDAGASLRDGMKTLKKIGACSEKMWPYDISKFTELPPANCYVAAKNHKIKKYMRLEQSLDQFKRCLEEGSPFIFGVLVYESFESEQASTTGVIPMPNVDDEKLCGGHALVCVGFDDSKECFIFRNSWGESWGDKGYGYIPYDYLLSKELSSDFWVIEKI